MIISGDLDSAELRVAAKLSGDKPFLEVFAAKGKPHLKTTRDLFGKDFAKGTEEYVFAKGFTYRAIYTLPGKIPTSDGQLRLYKVDMTPEQLAAMQHKFDKAHPALLGWKKKVIAQLHATHKVKNVFGRFRDLSWGLRTWDKALVEHVEQAALNFQVQSVIGKVINRAFLWLDAEIDRLRGEGEVSGWPCIQCHDELVIYTQNDNEAQILGETLKRAIEQPIPELDNMVIPTEVKYGESWGNV